MRGERIEYRRTGIVPDGTILDSIILIIVLFVPVVFEIVVRKFSNPMFSLLGFGIIFAAIVTSSWGLEDD
jgi:hypothetical protein